MPRLTRRERREAYEREYGFQKRSGKPFFPYAMLHDTITSLVTVMIIMGLAIIWHSGFQHPSASPTGGQNGGFLGPAYEPQADPGALSYDPRPEWYFFFLFQLLRIFSNPNLILFATIIIPTIFMVLLVAWPFIDRRPERRISRRPIAITFGVAIPVILLTLTWQGSQVGALGQASRHPGSAAFAAGGCANCHTFKDAGTAGSLANMDSLHPSYALAVQVITNGKPGTAMQPQSGTYNPTQIKCFAGYIATWAAESSPTTPGPSAGTVPPGVYPAICKQAGGNFAGG